jgi:hypothetical protein
MDMLMFSTWSAHDQEKKSSLVLKGHLFVAYRALNEMASMDTPSEIRVIILDQLKYDFPCSANRV